ncbi:MAG: hypothetical protein ACI3VN_10875 [Candidatus Onthomonas sp.]
MEMLREWLLAVLAASFLTAAAQAVMPEGPVKSVGRLICGLLLFLALARPVLGIQYASLAASIRDYSAQLAETQEGLEETNQRLTESIIVQETATYIQDKSSELGLDCRAEVTWDWSGQVPEPSEVTVTGELTDNQQQRFTQALTQDLGLKAEQIHYVTSNEEGP